MFVIGMELEWQALMKQAIRAVFIAHASMVFPFILGTGISLFLYASYAPAGIPFSSFALFMGIALSITAFPVLARILREKNMMQTRLGTLAIGCAAVGDLTAWCVFAALIALVRAGSSSNMLFTMGLVASYIFFMFWVARPVLNKIDKRLARNGSAGRSRMALAFIFLLLSAYLTEIIGIHALFGAFLAGVILPADAAFRKRLTESIEDLSLVLLLPLFFVYTGLRTQITLLHGAGDWTVCVLITFAAAAGKLGGTALAARWIGEKWNVCFSVGALMNARGLMELIVLSVGYDLGILSPAIFAMLVIMALVTTFATSPLLGLFRKPSGMK